MAWSLLVHLRSYRVAQTPVSNSCRSISDEAAEALPNPSSSPEIFSSFPCLSRLVQCYLGLLLRSQFLSPLLHSHASLLLPVRAISNTLRVIKVFWMPSDVSIGRETWSTWSIPVRITRVFSSDPLRSTEICVIGQMRYDRIDEWSIDRVIDDWNEQKIYFHGLESRSHEPRLFNVLSTRINLDRKVRLTLWKNKSCFKIKYVHLTGITDSPFREFRTPIYRIDYVNVKVPFSKVITRLPRVLRMIFKMNNKHFIFSRTKNRRTSFNTNIHSWQSLVIRLINSD